MNAGPFGRGEKKTNRTKKESEKKKGGGGKAGKNVKEKLSPTPSTVLSG